MYHLGRKISQGVYLQHVHRVQITPKRVILPFLNALVWTVKNASKRQLWTRIDRCVFADNKNALVWTGPYCDTPREHNNPLFYLTTLNKRLQGPLQKPTSDKFEAFNWCKNNLVKFAYSKGENGCFPLCPILLFVPRFVLRTVFPTRYIQVLIVFRSKVLTEDTPTGD